MAMPRRSLAAAAIVTGGLLSAGWQAPPASQRPRIFGIASVTIRTSDMTKARAFYGGVLGFKEKGPKALDGAMFLVNARQRLVIFAGLAPDQDERFVNVAFEADTAALFPFLQARSIQAAIVTVEPDLTPGSGSAGATYPALMDPDRHAVHFVPSVNAPDESEATPERRISRRILHVGLTIKDAAAADKFYKDVFGFSEIWRGGRPEGTTSWINMRVPDGTDYLEYMLYPNAPPTRTQLGSAHHIALLVPDIQQALETVRARTQPGERNHRATPNIGVNNRWQLNVFDPDGTRVEFMEGFTVR